MREKCITCERRWIESYCFYCLRNYKEEFMTDADRSVLSDKYKADKEAVEREERFNNFSK